MRSPSPFPDVPDVVRRRMSHVHKKDTKPERAVRQCAHALGYRFRLHRADLPGTPDLTFPRHRKVVFVHGCFWHQHEACRLAKLPQSRPEYWIPKLERNRARDQRAQEQLNQLGWECLVVWECETQDLAAVASKVQGFLDDWAAT